VSDESIPGRGRVFLAGEEGISQGLKPALGMGGDVQAKAWTYHKGKNNGKCGHSRFVRHYLKPYAPSEVQRQHLFLQPVRRRPFKAGLRQLKRDCANLRLGRYR
jgi:hypothetical protein